MTVSEPNTSSTPAAPPAAPPFEHAVSRLRATRLAASSKPFVARGANAQRCPHCRLATHLCICALRPQVPTHAGVCLLMGDIETLKPSNTGWLIADVVPDTWAFQWSRTEVEAALLALLSDPQWAPCVVFPPEYAKPGRAVAEVLPPAAGTGDATAKRPLFILLDGTWSEARKMFRKSPYLDRFPVLGLHPETASRYRLRRSAQDHHFCTAEVAALCLAQAGDVRAADALDAWFDVFSAHYLSMRRQQPVPLDSPVHQRLYALNAALA